MSQKLQTIKLKSVYYPDNCEDLAETLKEAVDTINQLVHKVNSLEARLNKTIEEIK